MLRQYRFVLDFGCEGTDFLVQWSGEKHRSRVGEALLLLAQFWPKIASQGSDVPGTT